MSNLKNPPAFPRPIGTGGGINGNKYNESQPGMTLRDYFAAKAMQSLLISQKQEPYYVISEDAYRIADHMLNRR